MIRPTAISVLVDPLYDPPTVETGLSPGAPALYMPDSGKNPMSQQGIVLEVGPDQEVVQVGDHILYHPFVQQPFTFEGYEYLIVHPRYIVGRLDLTGNLIPLPWDVVIKPDFPPGGRPKLVGQLWLPMQVFDTDVPASGVVQSTGAVVTSVKVGQRVLFPPEAGNEVGLRQVWYTIHEKDILAIIEMEVPVKVMVTPMQTGDRNAGRPD